MSLWPYYRVKKIIFKEEYILLEDNVPQHHQVNWEMTRDNNHNEI